MPQSPAPVLVTCGCPCLSLLLLKWKPANSGEVIVSSHLSDRLQPNWLTGRRCGEDNL